MAALRARGGATVLFTLALLVAAPGARADVLVPSDPPPSRAPGAVSCIAAVGDALAYQHEVGAPKGGERAPTVAQLDPGPLQSITLGRPVRIDDCPTAAGAADGTAAVGFLSIRRRRNGPRRRPPPGRRARRRAAGRRGRGSR